MKFHKLATVIALASALIAPQSVLLAQQQTPAAAAAPSTTQLQQEQAETSAQKKKGGMLGLFDGGGGQDKKKQPQTTNARPGQTPPASDKTGERLEPDDASAPPRSDVPVETLAHRRESVSEDEAQVVPYYNNFMSTYRLGPEDVISVSVFNLDRYSKSGIVVPPNGTISYPLIPEGVFVVGKTTEQVAAEITKKLDEYVIDPKVTVFLEKAQSAYFSVIGDVAQPGIRPMARRLTVLDALGLSGGVLNTGNKSKVTVLRHMKDGYIQQTVVNVAAIEKGKAPDNYILAPGDQIFVPGNRLKTVKEVLGYLPVISFFRIFTGGF